MKLRDFISEDLDRKARNCIGTISEMINTLEELNSEVEEFVQGCSDEWVERFDNGEAIGNFMEELEALKDDLENAKDNFEDGWNALDINVEDCIP